MKKILVAPSKFILGSGEINNLASYAAKYGTRALLVADSQTLAIVRSSLDKSTADTPFSFVTTNFIGECTHAEIARLKEICTQQNCGVVIGLGGGKSLDTAKAVAHYTKLPVFIVPTIASSDAPCSSLAVIYTENNEFLEYMFFDDSPKLVLVDSQIIANAPVRFLISGMGDALATFFEARSCTKAGAKNIPGGTSTLAALAIAKLCYDTLMTDSEKAIDACKSNVVTPALENIIEANILLSGIGFESSGLAAAHAIHDGLTVLSETHNLYHGEKVAFGTLTHLALENAPSGEISEVIAYCKKIGLPTCLADLNITNVTEEKIMAVATASCAQEETIHNMPFPVTPKMVYDAILAADRLGS